MEVNITAFAHTHTKHSDNTGIRTIEIQMRDWTALKEFKRGTGSLFDHFNAMRVAAILMVMH